MTMRYLFVCSPSHLLKFNWIAKQTLVSFMPFIQFHRRFHLYLSIFYLTFFSLVCFTLSAPFHHIFNFNLTMHLAGKIYIQIQISSFSTIPRAIGSWLAFLFPHTVHFSSFHRSVSMVLYLHFTFSIHTNYLHFHFDYPFASYTVAKFRQLQ